MMPASSAATERRFSVYSHIHSKKRNKLINDRAAKLLLVSHNENLLEKIKKGEGSIFIFDTIEDFVEVDWQEDIFESDADETDDSNEEEMPLTRLVCQK